MPCYKMGTCSEKFITAWHHHVPTSPSTIAHATASKSPSDAPSQVENTALLWNLTMQHITVFVHFHSPGTPTTKGKKWTNTELLLMIHIQKWLGGQVTGVCNLLWNTSRRQAGWLTGQMPDRHLRRYGGIVTLEGGSQESYIQGAGFPISHLSYLESRASESRETNLEAGMEMEARCVHSHF